MKISVIIPTLNSGTFLAERLTLLFQQTLPISEYEILVIDNGSTDNTTEILTRLCTQHENIRWLSQPVRGRSRARNLGIHESMGDLILFLDDDIVISTDHLERHLAYHLVTDRLIVVLGHVTDVSPVRPKWLQDYYHARQSIGSSTTENSDLTILQGLQFITGNVSLRRSTLEMVKRSEHAGEAYFDPSMVFREDADLGLRLIKAGVQFVVASDIQCLHHHPRNLDAMLKRSYQIGYSTERLIRKHPEAVATARYLTKSSWVNWMLLVLAVGLFVPAYILHFFWSEPLYKTIGGFLLYETNRGYQQALRDYLHNV